MHHFLQLTMEYQFLDLSHLSIPYNYDHQMYQY
nr:MAG TPA: hypothetical protein [Bacteriophage sp.]